MNFIKQILGIILCSLSFHYCSKKVEKSDTKIKVESTVANEEISDDVKSDSTTLFKVYQSIKKDSINYFNFYYSRDKDNTYYEVYKYDSVSIYNRKNDQIIQKIILYTMLDLGSYTEYEIGEIEFNDINFDGYLDFSIPLILSYSYSYTYFIFNPKTGKYKRTKVLDNLHDIYFDKNKKLIITSNRGNIHRSIDGLGIYEWTGSNSIKLIINLNEMHIDKSYYSCTYIKDKDTIEKKLTEKEYIKLYEKYAEYHR
jgi:hypothetical protein